MKQNKSFYAKQRIYMMRTILVLMSVAFLFGVIGGVSYFSKANQKKTYTSQFLKIQFEYPNEFTVKEESTNINLVKQEKEIKIGRYGTNFENAIEHTKNLVILNKISQPQIEEIQIGPYKAVRVVADENGTVTKAYFIVRNYAAYYLSTDAPSLFADLDEIVKTFRIIETP